MCGIVGFVGSGDRSVLTRMAQALAHRGPDDHGEFVVTDARVFLGHRRLAVIDVAGGQQPMTNVDGSVVVVFNGEIYNHLELRSELSRMGHRFRTHHSDTEVLVHGYEQWGDELPGRINGMFAFAIYDRFRNEILLARDRFGEKPLYYSLQGSTFGFASELSALTLHPAFPRSPSVRAVQKYFAYGYIPAPHALYEHCHKLPGGCRLRYRIEDGSLTTSSYWSFRIESDPRLGERAEEALTEELRGILDTAVKRRLLSDVPLGIFLSGGIDSSTTLAMASRHVDPSTIKTFCIGFNESSYDEAPFAREVAKAFGTQHAEDTLDLDKARDLALTILGRLDEPLGDASLVPTFLLSRFARNHVTVALSGDGGDELFGGYDTFKALLPARLYSMLVPRGLHRGLRRLFDLLPRTDGNMSFDFKIRRALTGLSYQQSVWNPVWLAPIEPELFAAAFEQPLRFEDLYDDALALWERSAESNMVDRTLEFYTNFYLPNDILAKVDRATMMVSLESRAVFLDNDLVEFCRRLPSQWKYRNGQRKYLLRQALQGLVPSRVLSRPKKGFGIPLSSWLRKFSEPRMAPMLKGLREQWFHCRWQEHRVSAADHRLLLWSWMSLAHTLNAKEEVSTTFPNLESA